ncbi:hypothetical protein NX059_003538 [Plenodomus lindquistii]|nr:hypothetical protein NX059_003538 [Plenodomus lindquistii]
MSARTIEVVYLPTKAGLDLSSGEAKTARDNTLNTIAKQPGVQALYWGTQVEHPDILQVVVEWDHVDSHKAFMASPEYQPFLDTLEKYILAGTVSTIKMFHADLAPSRSSTDPFTMPVTECLSAYLPADYDSATYVKQFNAFEDATHTIPDFQAKGILGGWSQEPAKHEGLGEGVEGKLFAVFLGWPDLEAHPNFAKSEHFLPSVGHLLEGMVSRDMVHVQFNKVK